MDVSQGTISCLRDPDRSRLRGLHHHPLKHLLNALELRRDGLGLVLHEVC